MDREDVISIDSNRMYPVARSSRDDSISSELLGAGGRDGIAVIATEEYHGSFQSSAKVQSGVEVTLAGSTFAEVANRY